MSLLDNLTFELTPEEYRFLYESNAIEGEYSDAAFSDTVNAWLTAKRLRLPLNFAHTMHIHECLMRTLSPRIAGKIRDCDVYVGGKKCLRPDLIKYALEQWFNDHGPAKTEETIKQAHIVFEEIHPFEERQWKNWTHLNELSTSSCQSTYTSHP